MTQFDSKATQPIEGYFVFDTFGVCRFAQRTGHLNNGNTSFINWCYGCYVCGPAVFEAEEAVVSSSSPSAVVISALKGSRTLECRL
jgi:hypothetical protein